MGLDQEYGSENRRLTFDEAAQVLGLSRSTVLRKWRFARAWLAGKLRETK